MNERVLAIVTDAASPMKHMVQTIFRVQKKIFLKAVHLFCAAHKLHNLASRVKDNMKDLDSAMMSAKSIFVKAPQRRRFFRENQFPLPPKPFHIRWGSWIKASKFYSDEANLNKFKEGLEALMNAANDQLVSFIHRIIIFQTNHKCVIFR